MISSIMTFEIPFEKSVARRAASSAGPPLAGLRHKDSRP
jgi:hypothetical protein